MWFNCNKLCRILLIHRCMNDLVSDSISTDHISYWMWETYLDRIASWLRQLPWMLEFWPRHWTKWKKKQKRKTKIARTIACEKLTNQMHSTIKSVTKLAIIRAHNKTKWTQRSEWMLPLHCLRYRIDVDKEQQTIQIAQPRAVYHIHLPPQPTWPILEKLTSDRAKAITANLNRETMREKDTESDWKQTNFYSNNIYSGLWQLERHNLCLCCFSLK